MVRRADGKTRDEGMSLIAVIMVLVPITLMLCSALTLLPVLARKSRSDHDKVISVLAAESGLQYAIGKLNSVGSAQGLPKTSETHFIPNDGGQFTLTYDSTAQTITSVGMYPDSESLPAGYSGRTATLSVGVTVTPGAGPSFVNLLDYAYPILAFGDKKPTVTVSADSDVGGDVLLNDHDATVSLSNPHVKWDYVENEMTLPGLVPHPNVTDNSSINKVVDKYENLDLKDGRKFVWHNLDIIGNKAVLNVDVSKGDVTIIVDNLNISGQGSLVIDVGNVSKNDTSKYRLNLYIKNTAKLTGYQQIGSARDMSAQDAHPEALAMYYMGTADFNLEQGNDTALDHPEYARCHFLLFADNCANMNLSAPGYAGSFMTNSTKVVMNNSFACDVPASGWAVGQHYPMLIYAPRADMTVDTTTLISGLITNTLVMDHAANIKKASKKGANAVNVSVLPSAYQDLVTKNTTSAAIATYTITPNTWAYSDPINP